LLTALGLVAVGALAYLVTTAIVMYSRQSQAEAYYWFLILGMVVSGSCLCLILTHALRTGRVGKWETRLMSSLAIVVAAVVLLASSAIYLRTADVEPLRESDGAITYEIRDLPGGFYKSWDYASVWIYSGEPTSEWSYIIYPITGVWPLNSTALAGTVDGVDFGERELGDCWFNLEVTDIDGNARVDDGDQLKVYSQNGSFPEDEVYYVEFVVRSQLNSGIAPYNVVLGFKFSFWGFDSWVEFGPVEFAW